MLVVSIAGGLMLLFKYLNPTGVARVLKKRHTVALRFALPKSYMDPYELFLEPERTLKSEDLRAFYRYFLDKPLQAPVTCFSTRPDSVVMWAQYCEGGTGACIGFHETRLAGQFSLAYVGDVIYQQEPAKISNDVIEWAYTTGKRRHSLRLLAVARRAAYFTKREDWQYERERRLVAHPDGLVKRGTGYLKAIRPTAVECIIVGARTEKNIRRLCERRAEEFNVQFLTVQNARRSYDPFFVGPHGETLRWRAGFREYARVCAECGEPVRSLRAGRCKWCDIGDDAQLSAPKRSMLALTLTLGIDKGVPLSFPDLKPLGAWPLKWKRGNTRKARAKAKLA